MIGRLYTKVGGTCADATVTNGATYTDTVASGGTLLLPTEDITVNGNLLVNKPSVEDYNVEVVNSDNNPVGAVDGSQVVVAESVISIAGGNIYVVAEGSAIITHEDTNGNPVNTSLNGTTVVVDDLPCSVDSKEWVLQFIDQTDIIQVVADAGNIATFTSGSGANIGTMEVSTDGITYAPISYPFTPSAGTYYFKRSTALITATYTISE